MRGNEYYEHKLSAERLRRCYEIASPRVRQYLRAEIDHVIHDISPGAAVLELGCGYGRVLHRLLPLCEHLVGIDTSLASLQLAGDPARDDRRLSLYCMNAASLGFPDNCFDLVIGVQNSISAFGVDRSRLIEEAVRVTKPVTGRVLFSSYSQRFWTHRLQWFEDQAQAGLIGEIDYERTGRGEIVCRDGFRSSTVSEAEFRERTDRPGWQVSLQEVDQSSLFCTVSKSRQ